LHAVAATSVVERDDRRRTLRRGVAAVRPTTILALGALLALSACAGSGPSHDAARNAAPSTARAEQTTTTTAAAGPPAAVRVFAASSPWYQPVPVDQPAGPEGFTYGQEIAAEISRGYGHASFNTHKYSPVVYRVDAGAPTVPVGMWNCQDKPQLDDGLLEQFSAVPVPADAIIPPDSDAHVAIWQPATDTVWEMWRARRVADRWEACWGGRLEHASQSVGTFDFPYGPTASGVSLLAGLVTLDDLRSGSIDHAVAIAVGSVRAGAVSWPANRTDGKSGAPNALPAGQRLRLDPSVDVASLPLTPIGRMVATALQRYGAIVRDTSVGSVSIYAQYPDPSLTGGGPDPYVAFFGGQPKWAQLDGIPWDRLEALPSDYGRGES
jgi:hypothetical protein